MQRSRAHRGRPFVGQEVYGRGLVEGGVRRDLVCKGASDGTGRAAWRMVPGRRDAVSKGRSRGGYGVACVNVQTVSVEGEPGEFAKKIVQLLEAWLSCLKQVVAGQVALCTKIQAEAGEA